MAAKTDLYRGALNTYVQTSGVRSRTPLINADVYAKSTTAFEPTTRLSKQIMEPVRLGQHKKTISSNNLQNSVTVTPIKSSHSRLGEANQQSITRGTNCRTPVRPVTASGHTPQRHSFMDRSRYVGSVTTPIDRASESLEKINEVFRQISVGLFDQLQQIKRPQKVESDGCQIFVRFMNAFRSPQDQWDITGLHTWDSLRSFMLYSPNSQKICLEIQ